MTSLNSSPIRVEAVRYVVLTTQPLGAGASITTMHVAPANTPAGPVFVVSFAGAVMRGLVTSKMIPAFYFQHSATSKGAIRLGWGQRKYENRNKPYEADYNRAFDTHTQHDANQAFAVNPPYLADTGPDNIPGVNTARGYTSPLKTAIDPGDYLGSNVGAREIQTGNAPSGGYNVRPGLGWAPVLDGEVFPDNHRARPMSRDDDWENNQARINRWDLGGEKDARRARVREAETFTNAGDRLPTPFGQINAVTDSPYRRDWPEGHGPNGEFAPTTRTNPNPFRFLVDWNNPGAGYRGVGARYLNGEHYSMAQHNSLQPYVNQAEGGTPVRQVLRNTYRLDPQPWDVGRTDSPTNTEEYRSTVSAGTDVGGYGNSYRL